LSEKRAGKNTKKFIVKPPVTMPESGDRGSRNLSSWKSSFRADLFAGKVALVTGGGTGIGYCIAKELALLGATVVIASRSREKCEEAANEMNAQINNLKQVEHQHQQSLQNIFMGKIVAGPSTSIRDEEQVKNLIKFIIEKYGKLNLVVNNAGGQYVSEAVDISKKGFSAVVDTNLVGTFSVCKEAYSQYMQDHGGSIVNITLGNRNGFPLMSHSGAARAGVENMSITLSQEWMESGVRVNCVRPGIIFTKSGFQNYGPMGDEFLAKVVVGQPSRRLGSPEEVSSATCWLLSEGASYVTGTVLQVDGGSAYHFSNLLEFSNDTHHLPIYGTLPPKARL
jgi:peroxisomal trans-2-enoyl-CoA reductase